MEKRSWMLDKEADVEASVGWWQEDWVQMRSMNGIPLSLWNVKECWEVVKIGGYGVSGCQQQITDCSL